MAELIAARPDIVFVGLGSPKQEHVIASLRSCLPSAWWLGVGISFSFVCNRVRRAPPWMQKLGLEWVHRLWQEPGRLARRYLIDGLPFAATMFARCGWAPVEGTLQPARTAVRGLRNSRDCVMATQTRPATMEWVSPASPGATAIPVRRRFHRHMHGRYFLAFALGLIAALGGAYAGYISVQAVVSQHRFCESPHSRCAFSMRNPKSPRRFSTASSMCKSISCAAGRSSWRCCTTRSGSRRIPTSRRWSPRPSCAISRSRIRRAASSSTSRTPTRRPRAPRSA